MQVLQTSIPEAILDIDVDSDCFSQSFDNSEYDAMAIGPGIGTSAYTVQAFIEQVRMAKCPAVVDADALNIASCGYASCHDALFSRPIKRNFSDSSVLHATRTMNWSVRVILPCASSYILSLKVLFLLW